MVVVQLSPILFKDRISVWTSKSHNNSNVCWESTAQSNERLYKTVENQTKIEIKKSGYYRVCAFVSSYLNGANQASMSINNSQYCVSAMGTYGTSYYNAHYFSEIVQLKASDKIHFNCPSFYAGSTMNSVFIEKLFVE